MARPAPTGGRLFASFLGALGVMLWATETTLINLVLHIPPLQVVALAFGFAALMTPVVCRITGQSPWLAFRLPKRVWLLMVSALVGYHSCIYFATQRAPAAPAALLQGTTPLLIVLGSALLPGERLRWWHVTGAMLGFAGIASLINFGQGSGVDHPDAGFYLAMIGAAAGLWGLYSVLARTLTDVPTSALGIFYGASALVAFAAHLVLEPWVTPVGTEWLAIAALGLLPMGIAIYLWDYGLKHGDIQALGAFSYTEPFIGAVLVAVVTKASFGLDLIWAGALVTAGAIMASASLWQKTAPVSPPAIVPAEELDELAVLRAELADLGARIFDRLDHPERLSLPQRRELERLLEDAQTFWDMLDMPGASQSLRAAA